MRRAELARGGAPAAVGLSLLAAACGAGAAAPQSAGPAPRGWDNTLAGLRAADQRVADVAYRIVTANVALCPDVKPQTGLVLQSALEYRPRLRADVEAAFHIDDRAAIEAVADGSPAAAAGLQRDDILIAVNGRLLPTPAPPPASGPDDRPTSLAPVESALAAIDAALAAGPARVRVQRGAAQLEATLASQPGCAYDARVLPGPSRDASADGLSVFISVGLVDYAKSDDMLALALGHEFAHDLLRHHHQLDESGRSSPPSAYRLAEQQADYVGLYLTARAGYDISQAPDFWRQLPSKFGDIRWAPSHRERAVSLAATRDEIIGKRQRGEPLTPEPTGPVRASP
jgi:hypothetical protein